MENKKVRMLVEFDINGETLEEKGKTAEEVVNAIEMHDHDTIDGFEIYPSLDGCDLCSDFFLCNPRVISKEIVGETNIPARISKARELMGNPTGIDADIILYDAIEEADFEITGIAECVLRAWEKSTDKKAVEEMFYIFTNMRLEDFLEKCIRNLYLNNKKTPMFEIVLTRLDEFGKETEFKTLGPFTNKAAAEEYVKSHEQDFADDPEIYSIKIGMKL